MFPRPEPAVVEIQGKNDVVFIADEDDCSFQSSTLLGPESAALGPLQSFRCTRFGVTCDVGGTSPDTMNQVGTKDQCHPTAGSAYLFCPSISAVHFLAGTPVSSIPTARTR